MASTKTELIPMLIKEVELEHTARVQFFSDLGMYSGPVSATAIDMLKKIAADEETQEKRFKTMVEDWMEGARRPESLPDRRIRFNEFGKVENELHHVLING